MAEDLTAPILNLTPEEKRLYGHLFRLADSESIGVVTGEVAVKFFEKTRLEPRVLGEIWQIADKENRGLLTPAGFGVVLRLIGHYQAGREPTSELALRPGPLPKFDNALTLSQSPTMRSPSFPSPGALLPQASGSGPIRVPPLTPETARRYAAIFEKSGAQNGLLPGEQAKQIFERAGLSNEILGGIWNLVDTDQRGALQATEFVIAMHLLASFKTGQLRVLPSTLPFGLYEAASLQALNRPASGTAVLSSISTQYSGTALPANSSARPTYSMPTPPQFLPQITGSGVDWIISPADKLKFDHIYNSLDKTNRGFITGNEAVPFFSESKLSEEALAQIWDLADINSAGRLSKDEFAVAMYLIRQQRGKRDGRDSLPEILPANLIPPSMRNQERPKTVPTAPDFDAPATTFSKSATEDLFGLDALSSHPISSEQAPQMTTSDLDSLEISSTPASLNSSQNPPIFKPFTPSSSFGQSISHQSLGPQKFSPSEGSALAQTPISEDLLGDNDPVISKKLTSETTELANLSNQVGSLTQKIQEVQVQQTAHRNDLAQASSQKLELETRLDQLRALYEHELLETQNLEQRLSKSQKKTQLLKTDFESLQVTVKGLRNQQQQLFTALQADQEENLKLKDSIREVNGEIAMLKPALEKLVSESRQQKGLVAINKKQLSLGESERDKLKSEAEGLRMRDNAEALSSISSPALSLMSAKNPFFRQKSSITESPQSYFTAPTAGTQQLDRSVTSVFGPEFDSAAVSNESSTLNSNSNETRPSPLGSISSGVTQIQKTGSSDFQINSESQSTSSEPGKTVDHSTPTDTKPRSSDVLKSPLFEEPKDQSPQISSHGRSFEKDLNSVPGPEGSMLTNSTTDDPFDSRYTLPPHVDFKSNTPLSAPETNVGTFLVSQRTGTAKDDFDSAFADFGSVTKTRESLNAEGFNGSGSVSEAKETSILKEFPPITELENDDSESDSDGVGFDDDFAPASPGHFRQASITQEISKATSESSTQKQTPEYKVSSGHDSIPQSTILQNLPRVDSLPTDINPDKPKTDPSLNFLSNYVTSSNPSGSNSSSDHHLDRTPNPLVISSNYLKPNSPPPVPSKITHDDEFDEFDDLEDAKEGDTDDDFAKIAATYQTGANHSNLLIDKTSQVGGDKSHREPSVKSDTASSQPIEVVSKANENHDWDAIFAGLESPVAVTDLAQDSKIVKANEPNLNASGALAPADLPDDPILKNLTGMGYTRAQALSALEKYDYNLERAADYLANQF